MMRDTYQREKDRKKRYELTLPKQLGLIYQNLTWAEATGLLLGAIALDPTQTAKIIRTDDGCFETVLLLDPDMGIDHHW